MTTRRPDPSTPDRAELRRLFLDALPAKVRSRYETLAATALGVLLHRLVASARQGWPLVRVQDDELLRYLAVRAPDEDAPLAALAGLHVAELYLCCACVAGDAGAMASFDAHYLITLEPALARAGAPPQLVDELLQLLRIQLLVSEDGRAAGIAKFSGRGALRGWLRVVALRELIRQRRRWQKDAHIEDDHLLETLFPGGNTERQLTKLRHYADVKGAFEEAILALSPKERLLLRQHVIDGLNIDQLGAQHRVHRATAFRWIEKARARLVSVTRRALTQRLRISLGEADSLLRLSLSHLNLSLMRLFELKQPGRS